ncbi:ATG8-interacting protein 1 [Impatiens glandulifera]|uniref:ATG8-interacting protein 1 n=1 Tax=Impatiens glandulifera TaxID=253017 RepID=UPI001FB15759|nr:ATG8-interacting protein 1 [Impatiens glandulifera]XP_047320022.1 ATG8-interacting protein 1 [Impatiens glandulifera]
MANNEVESNALRGVEWEVVSPTTSAAAAPSIEQVECDTDEDQADNTLRALFMSGHFVFPPSQHENLPIEPETIQMDTLSDMMEGDVIDESTNQEHLKDDKQNDAPELPCNAWWKRRAVSIYTHAKDTNAFWSIFVAAAVMGIVIIGQQWQKERWQVLQHKWRFLLDEKMGRMLVRPMSRLKYVIAGGNRSGSLADH